MAAKSLGKYFHACVMCPGLCLLNDTIKIVREKKLSKYGKGEKEKSIFNAFSSTLIGLDLNFVKL